MLQIPGAPALSSFRIAKLLDLLRSRAPDVTGLDSHFVHFADVERPLTAGERGILERLLTCGPRIEESGDASGAVVIVVPRAGTISVMRSKSGAARFASCSRPSARLA